ncbi:hypothetical protein [Bacteroides sp. MSB163]
MSLRNGLRGYSLRSGGEVTTASVERLLRLSGNRKDSFAAPASVSPEG